MNKKNLVLGGILVVLIALAYFYQGLWQDWRSRKGQPENFLAVVDVNQINKIEITNSSQVTTLEKIGDRWKISGSGEFYVQDSLATNLNTSLEEATKSAVELASDNKDKKSEFQTDQSGIKIKLIQGEQVVADFIIGKRGTDYTSTYIAQLDSDKTYIVQANLSVFNRSDWYDRTIFSGDRSTITKIRFQYPNREFTIEKVTTNDTDETDEEEQWQGMLPYKFDVSLEKINPILNIMANLTAAEIPEQIFEGTGLEKNLIIVQATGEGIDNTIMIGDPSTGSRQDTIIEEDQPTSAEATAGEEEPQYYYAKKADSDNIYLISKSQRDQLDKQIWELK